jgi:hypothetical protein
MSGEQARNLKKRNGFKEMEYWRLLMLTPGKSGAGKRRYKGAKIQRGKDAHSE